MTNAVVYRTVAIMPLKAHSERVPHKNFRNFAGRPLFLWVLNTLLSLEDISLVVINTDARDELIANGIPDSDRLFIRDRRPGLCGDKVSMNLIIGDDISAVSAKTYLMTHTTNPLLSRQTISAALETYHRAVKDGSADSLFTVNRFQSRFYRGDASPVNHDPAKLLRTQDLEPWFEENSNLYLFSRGSFRGSGGRIGKKPLLFETPRRESVDIDDQDSWALAESIARGNSAPRNTTP